MQTIVTDVCGVCLSRGSTQFHCAKTAKQIKMLCGVNTPGAHGTLLCYTEFLIPHREMEADMRKILPIVDPLHISGRLKLETWNFVCLVRAGGSNENCAKVGHTEVRGGITWPTFFFCDPLHISRTATARVLRVLCVRCIRCSLCQITLAFC